MKILGKHCALEAGPVSPPRSWTYLPGSKVINCSSVAPWCYWVVDMQGENQPQSLVFPSKEKLNRWPMHGQKQAETGLLAIAERITSSLKCLNPSQQIDWPLRQWVHSHGNETAKGLGCRSSCRQKWSCPPERSPAGASTWPRGGNVPQGLLWFKAVSPCSD